MNQQRSRRYRSAKEIEDKREEEEKMRNEWTLNGKKLPPKKPPTWDHNVITPGTPFMHRLSRFLRYYVHHRVSTDPGWKNIQVILSDAGVPGEGEHKVMEFIRLQRAQPGYNPNTRHAIHGKDADLIMLALACHEPRFSILRELDLTPQNRRMQSNEQVRLCIHLFSICKYIPSPEGSSSRVLGLMRSWIDSIQ
jgi:5'-3' exoribonuclease 2